MRLRLFSAVVAATAAATTACSSGVPAPRPSNSAEVGTVAAPTAAGGPSQPPRARSSQPRPQLPRHRAPSPAHLRARARAAVDAIVASQPPGAVSVAALDTRTGAAFAAGRRSGMWTASAYKLFLLVNLLVQRQYDDSTGLSGYEQDLAVRAIENSDNAAGYSLYEDVGGADAMTDLAQRLGMTHTVPAYDDPTFTRTGAPDYLRLLEALVRPGVLNPASRAYALHLMRDVESDQRWGVGVVADRGTAFANKNGWLSIDNSNPPGETDNGRWVVSSAGVVTVHHERLLMAVFTQHQPDFATGVRLVERLAKAVAPAVAP